MSGSFFRRHLVVIGLVISGIILGYVFQAAAETCTTDFEYCDGTTCTEIVERPDTDGIPCNEGPPDIIQACPDKPVQPNCLPLPWCSVSFSPSVGIATFPLTISGTSEHDADGQAPYECSGSLGSGTAPASGSKELTFPEDSQTCTFTVENSAGRATCSASITAFPLTIPDLPSVPGPPERHTLEVRKIGSGSGTITGAGIICVNCIAHSATYFSGVEISMTASPAAGSVFAEWSGACAGSARTCTLAMDGDKLLVGRFEPIPRPAGQKFALNDRVRATDWLNVRALPRVDASLLGTVPPGTQGTVVAGPVAGDGFIWWRIRYDTGITGWSAEDWLELVAAPPMPEAKFRLDDRVVALVRLNVRESPGTNAPIVGTAPSGAAGTVIGGPSVASGYTWWQVRYDMGISGWSAENWLNPAAP